MSRDTSNMTTHPPTFEMVRRQKNGSDCNREEAATNHDVVQRPLPYLRPERAEVLDPKLVGPTEPSLFRHDPEPSPGRQQPKADHVACPVHGYSVPPNSGPNVRSLPIGSSTK